MARLDETNTPIHFPFDHPDAWAEVVPHLPSVEHLLHAGLTDFCSQHRKRTTYDPQRGPWEYCPSDLWEMHAQYAADEAGVFDLVLEEFGLERFRDPPDDAEEFLEDFFELNPEIEIRYEDRLAQLTEPFYPNPGTPDYYRCHHACHWMVEWHLALARLTVPILSWKPLVGKYHSTVVGFDPQRPRRLLMVFDILRSQQELAQDTIRDARKKKLAEDRTAD